MKPHAEEVRAEIDSDPKLQKQMASDPVGTVLQASGKVMDRALERDTWVYRGVIIALGTVLFLAAAGFVAMGLLDKEVPQALVAIASAAVGAMAALLAPIPIRG
jgi:hypothetical protein